MPVYVPVYMPARNPKKETAYGGLSLARTGREEQSDEKEKKYKEHI
jgi:hypothetical protein